MAQTEFKRSGSVSDSGSGLGSDMALGLGSNTGQAALE